MLPQIALGHSQSSIINTAYFENEILKLHEIMIPPLMSSTMSSEQVLGNGKSAEPGQTTGKGGAANKTKSEEKEAGRPEKPDD